LERVVVGVVNLVMRFANKTRFMVMLLLVALIASIFGSTAQAASVYKYVDLGSPQTVATFGPIGGALSDFGFYRADGSEILFSGNPTADGAYMDMAPVPNVRYMRIGETGGNITSIRWGPDGSVNPPPNTVAATTTNPMPDSTPPANVSSLTVDTITETTATLHFHTPNTIDLTQYMVKLNGVNGTWTNVSQSANVTHSLTGLTVGTSYTVTVLTRDDHGNSDPTGTSTTFSTVAPDTTPPEPPVLTGTPGDKKVTLTWTEPADVGGGVAGYNVFNGTTKQNTSLITARTFTVSGLSESTQYNFRVTAVDVAGNESQYSNQVSVTTLDLTAPEAPTGLVGTAGDKTASLTWVPSTSGDVQGYTVYRDGVKQNGTLITGNTYSQTDLVNGTVYSYKVTASDGKNESGFSNVVSVAPGLLPLDVNLTPNGNSIIVAISYGESPYEVTWDNGTQPGLTKPLYYIQGLTLSTVYTVTVTDNLGATVTKTVNTGTKVSALPPEMPDSQSLFQTLVNSFGQAGAIALVVIGGAVGLGCLVILAMWAWRLTKKWLASSK
jgi:hypothetical protein